MEEPYKSGLEHLRVASLAKGKVYEESIKSASDKFLEASQLALPGSTEEAWSYVRASFCLNLRGEQEASQVVGSGTTSSTRVSIR